MKYEVRFLSENVILPEIAEERSCPNCGQKYIVYPEIGVSTMSLECEYGDCKENDSKQKGKEE